ncbi:hypothetical protein Goari_014024, partial [Gossypium aridum]|nr:hypothetical protein [Gossypium aridum]
MLREKQILQLIAWPRRGVVILRNDS